MEQSKKTAIVFTGWLACLINRHLNQKVKNYLELNGYTLTTVTEDAELIIFAGCGVAESVELYNLKELAYLEHIVEEQNKGQKIILISCLKKINDKTRGTHYDSEMNKREVVLANKYVADSNSQYIFIDNYDYSVFDKLINAQIKFELIPEPNDISLSSGFETMQLAKKALKEISPEIKRDFQEEGLLQANLQSKVYNMGFFFPIYVDYLAMYGFKNICIGMGCKNYCTYCAIKFAKPKLKSITQSQILNQIKELQKKGEHNYLFLCDDMRSWGIDLKQTWIDLFEGIEKISTSETKLALFNVKVEDILHEKKTFDRLVDKGLISYIGAMAQHINKDVLTMMNREPFEEDDLINLINEYGSKGVHFHSYNIIGFPGETESQFMQLLNSLKKVKTENYSILNFPYSNRLGTKAASSERIDQDIIRDRLMRINNEFITTSKQRISNLPENIKEILGELISSTTKSEENLEKFGHFLCEVI